MLNFTFKRKRRKKEKPLNSSIHRYCHWFWSQFHPFGTLTQCPCHMLSVCRVSGDLLDALPSSCWEGWPMGLSTVTLAFWTRGYCITDLGGAQLLYVWAEPTASLLNSFTRVCWSTGWMLFPWICKWRIVSKCQWCRQTGLKGQEPWKEQFQIFILF